MGWKTILTSFGFTRVAANAKWQLSFPYAIVENLPAYGLDHPPIFLHTTPDNKKWRPRSFRFEWLWKSHEDCREIILQIWQAPISQEQPLTIP